MIILVREDICLDFEGFVFDEFENDLVVKYKYDLFKIVENNKGCFKPEIYSEFSACVWTKPILDDFGHFVSRCYLFKNREEMQSHISKYDVSKLLES